MRVSTIVAVLLLLAGMLTHAFGLTHYSGLGWPRKWDHVGGWIAFAAGLWIMIACGELLWRRATRRTRTPANE